MIAPVSELAPLRMADLAARHAEVAQAVESRSLAVLRSGQYVGGPVVSEIERRFAQAFAREEAVGVASGTDALILALQALGVRAGDEVIVPALTFFATAGAVCQLGAIPVLVDVGEDGCLPPAAAQAALTSKTRAILPVHLFGNRAEYPDLGVAVIDDAAQAAGGAPAPSIGDLTAVSVYPTKTWGAAGDGGFVLGDRPLIDRVRLLANHGAGPPHYHHAVEGHVGRNSRLDALQAAVLLGHAEAIPRRVAHRQRLAARYDAQLPPAARPLPRHPSSPVHQYLILVDDRERVRQGLAAERIETAIYYPRLLTEQPALQHAISHPTPVASSLCARLLALPVHEGLTDADIDRVLAALHRYCP